MGLDLEIWRPSSRKSRGKRPRIGWAGNPGNLWHLEKLREPLRRLSQKREDIEVAVFSGRRPSFDFPYEYVPYSQGAECEFVAGLDVGLLPLDSEPYSLGKSPIKALQYMSCGVAVVGNAAGASAELLDGRNGVVIRSESEWLPALEGILSVPERLREVGMAGRRFVEERHDLRKVTEQQIERLVDQLSDQRARTSLGPADVRGLRSE